MRQSVACLANVATMCDLLCRMGCRLFSAAPDAAIAILVRMRLAWARGTSYIPLIVERYMILQRLHYVSIDYGHSSTSYRYQVVPGTWCLVIDYRYVLLHVYQ